MGARPLRAGAQPKPMVAVTYEELLRTFEGRSSNLEILDAAYKSAKAWGKKTAPNI